MSIRVKFWEGKMTSKTMLNVGWLQTWLKAARQAEDDGFELVVFKIKKARHSDLADGEIIEEIETFLQERQL